MTPDLVQAIVDHLDRLHRAGQPTNPDAFLVLNRRTPHPRPRRQDRHRSQRGSIAPTPAAGLPALPHITPHSLRLTYISLALLANDYDIKWV